MLRTSNSGDNGVSGGSEGKLSHAGGEELRDEIGFYLTCEVTGLVGG